MLGPMEVDQSRSWPPSPPIRIRRRPTWSVGWVSRPRPRAMASPQFRRNPTLRAPLRRREFEIAERPRHPTLGYARSRRFAKAHRSGHANPTYALIGAWHKICRSQKPPWRVRRASPRNGARLLTWKLMEVHRSNLSRRIEESFEDVEEHSIDGPGINRG